MTVEGEYVRSELLDRFNELQKRLENFKDELKNAKLATTEMLVELETRLGPGLNHVQERIEVIKLQLEAFASDDEAEWGRLRQSTEEEWNQLSGILDEAEEQLRYAKDKAQLPPYLKPRDTLERDYSVSGRI